MSSSCSFCSSLCSSPSTVRGDLVRLLGKILLRTGRKKLDAIIIETTGLADPAPVAQTFFMDGQAIFFLFFFYFFLFFHTRYYYFVCLLFF